MSIQNPVMNSFPPTTPGEMDENLSAQIVRLQGELQAKQGVVEQLTQERDRLRQAYEHLRLELELLKRRLFVAKAERVDTAQLEMEFAGKLAAFDSLQAHLDKELEQTAPPP